MKVCVLGGGAFGCTAAIYAARAGHEVELFEAKDGLLRGASGTNQFRLHSGYHYPRSPETARESRDGSETFEAEYGAAIRRSQNCKYAIARCGSRVTPAEYLDFCEGMMLSYRIITTGTILNPDEIELVIDGHEGRYDPSILRGLVWDRLRQSGVKVRLGEAHWNARARLLQSGFDKIVVATYSGINQVLQTFGLPPQEYQFEVCEKPVVKMPEAFGSQTSIVVMDGEFCSVDPFGNSGLHVLGHVKYAIHHTNVGTEPEVPDELRSYLDRGIIRSPDGTKVWSIIDHGSKFIPMLAQAEHVGSFFVVRAVLPNLDKTDARPTVVQELDDKIISIFSGKISTCVVSAQRVVSILDGENKERDQCRDVSLVA